MSDDEVAQLWHPCALEGQVPVLVSGHATRGSLLVPSGQEDGYARAIQPLQLSDEPHLCRCILGRVVESSCERADGYNTLLLTHSLQEYAHTQNLLLVVHIYTLSYERITVAGVRLRM